jgi:hypothetical protein
VSANTIKQKPNHCVGLTLEALSDKTTIKSPIKVMAMKNHKDIAIPVSKHKFSVLVWLKDCVDEDTKKPSILLGFHI